MAKILVTGGCGYIGSVLVPKLLELGHKVIVVDLQWFGNHLPEHPNMAVLRLDIRDAVDLAGVDTVIHLASVANDPCGDLDPELTWEINCTATEWLAEQAVEAGVKQFIYASSGSVYGISSAPRVTEDLPCVPVSAYNETKAAAEKALQRFSDRMAVQILRPGTVCGYSPRMRLDVIVNRKIMESLTRHRMALLGGDQIRPNIHIDDMVSAYLFMLERPELTGIFNVAFENLSVLEICGLIQNKIGGSIDPRPSDDPRSYRMCSDKILAAGFAPQKTVADAIDDLAARYAEGKLKDTDECHNILTMQKLNLQAA